MKIPFSKVACDGHEREYVNAVLDSGWLTTAGRAREFETRFAEAINAQYACAVNSCTAALHLALEAVGVGAGDKVLVPTWTFTASAEVVRYLGAEPVLLDVDYGTGLLTPEILQTGLECHPSAKAVVIVHFGGQCARMATADGNGIAEICERRHVALIEDAAHAFPAKFEGRAAGTFGKAGCFSFYANKTITTGEGGMLVTNDADVFNRVKIMRLHGIDRDVWSRFTSPKPAWEYDVIAPGYKYNMPDINAAIGLAQLERAETLRLERERCARFYLKTLSACSSIDLPDIRVPFSDHAWHLFPIVLRENAAILRDDFIAEMARCGIGTSVHYKPLHRMTYYRERYRLQPAEFPNAERLWRGCVSLPIYPSLSETELRIVAEAVLKLLQPRAVTGFRPEEATAAAAPEILNQQVKRGVDGCSAETKSHT